MHRFVAEMDAHRAPPGMWSPLALAVLTMAGGVGVGLGLLSLLLPLAGAAAAAFALVLACAATALVLAIGVVAFMGGHAYGLVLLRRLALGLAAAGAGPDRLDPGRHARGGAGSGAVLRTGRLAGAGQQCLLCLRRLPDGAAGDGPARGPPALTRRRYRARPLPGGVGPALDSSTAWRQRCMRAARTDSGQAGWKVRSACHLEANSSWPDQKPTARPARPAAPSAVDSDTRGRTTGTPSRSACICMSRSLRAAPPSTRSSVRAMPLSPFMQVSSSALCSAMDSSVARAMWARVVPRVSPTRVPRA